MLTLRTLLAALCIVVPTHAGEIDHIRTFGTIGKEQHNLPAVELPASKSKPAKPNPTQSAREIARRCLSGDRSEWATNYRNDRG